MTRVSCDFVNTMQKAAVPAVSAVIFWSSRFLKYKFGAGTQAVEGNVNWKTVLLKDVVVRENAPLFVQQKRQSVRDLASKFEKGLAIAEIFGTYLQFSTPWPFSDIVFSMFQLCGIKGGNATAQAFIWQAKPGLSY